MLISLGLSSFREWTISLFQTDNDVCFGCGLNITDRFILRVSDQSWHVDCLRCCVCQTTLERQTTCFIKEDHIYCRLDYAR